jgi:hypothetical protein
MGYYIESCEKMRYKARYSPSELLCLDTFKWFDVDECIEKIKAVEGGCVPRFADVDMEGDKDDDADLRGVDAGVTQDTWDDKEVLEQKKRDLAVFVGLVGAGNVGGYKILI